VAARYVDVDGLATALGVGKAEVALLVRLCAWQVITQGVQGQVIWDAGDARAERADVDALRPSRDALRASAQGVLRALCDKLLSLVPSPAGAEAVAATAEPLARLSVGSLQALRASAPCSDAGGEAVQAVQADAQRAAALRVQAWWAALPPAAAQDLALITAITCFEADPSADTLCALADALRACHLSPPRALASASISRVLMLDQGLGPGHMAWAGLIAWWQAAGAPLDGGAESLLWRAPSSPPLPPDATPADESLRALLRACYAPTCLQDALTGQLDDGSARARAVAVGRALTATHPALGWHLLRLAADLDDPTLPLIDALRDLLRATYGLPAWLPPAPQPPFLLPLPPPSPPPTDWARTHLARVFFDAVLGAALENLPANPNPDATFRARVAPALAFLDHLPGQAPPLRARPRRSNAHGPSLTTAAVTLTIASALIALLGWALLRWLR
jgi:hypothetical protein